MPSTLSPSSHSTLDAATIQAYQHAWYEVMPALQQYPITLQVGVAQPTMQQVLLAHGAACACVLTACNPLGQLLTPEENALRMQQCKRALLHAGWTFVPAFGRDPLGHWPGEDSVLVWHMARADAQEWGRRWQQNAVLWMDAKAQPELLLLR